MSSSVEDLKYHLVFATKYRYNLISTKVAEMLKNYFLKQQDKLGFVIQSLAIESNHVHMLFQLKSSTQDLNQIIQKLKGGSSFLARKNSKELKRYSSLWTPSHFISIGNISKETIQHYINSQGIEEKEMIQRTFKFKILTPTKIKLGKLKTYFEECMNGKLEMWEKFYVNDIKYVGLPANQILVVRKKYGTENVFACEKNKLMARFMFDLQRHFSKPPYAEIINDDIFNYLETTNNKFSIYDFDLMCHANNKGLIERISNCIIKTAQDKAVINIVTTVGRQISNLEYKCIMPADIINVLKQNDFSILDTYSGEYMDKITPMRFEFIAIKKNENSK